MSFQPEILQQEDVKQSIEVAPRLFLHFWENKLCANP